MYLQASARLLEDNASGLSGPPLHVQQVSTTGHKAKDRLGCWSEYVSRHSQVLAMPNTPQHDYRTVATLRERGEINIVNAVFDPIGFERTPKHVARYRADRVRISYCRRVAGGIESGGKAATISDGAVYFRDYRGPGCFWTHGVTDETWLFVPREWFTDSKAVAPHFDCAVFQSDAFLARLMAQRVEAMVTHAGADAARFGQAVGALRQSVEDIFAARSSESHRKSLLVKADRLRRIKAYMARHAGDPDLTPDRIADALGLARSTLYRLLQDEGLQVNAHVAEYRLTAIARTLRDPAWAPCSIGEIGALWGHFDQAYLTRAFKRRFGVTPSHYRAQGVVETVRAYL